jgi:hypothetical protein
MMIRKFSKLEEGLKKTCKIIQWISKENGQKLREDKETTKWTHRGFQQTPKWN